MTHNDSVNNVKIIDDFVINIKIDEDIINCNLKNYWLKK